MSFIRAPKRPWAALEQVRTFSILSAHVHKACRRSTSEFTQRGPMGGSLGGINDPNTRIMGLPRSLSTGQLLEGSHEGLVSFT